MTGDKLILKDCLEIKQHAKLPKKLKPDVCRNQIQQKLIHDLSGPSDLFRHFPKKFCNKVFTQFFRHSTFICIRVLYVMTQFNGPFSMILEFYFDAYKSVHMKYMCRWKFKEGHKKFLYRKSWIEFKEGHKKFWYRKSWIILVSFNLMPNQNIVFNLFWEHRIFVSEFCHYYTFFNRHCLAFSLRFWPKIKRFLSNCSTSDWTFSFKTAGFCYIV